MGDVVIPYVFGALMALEYVYNALRANGHQTPRDSAVSLMVQVPHVALITILPALWFAVYRQLEPLVPWQIPHGWWIWPIGIVVMDFAAYWMHRYHHALNLTWGVHSVHHSSDEFTITTGGRSSMAEPIVNVLSGAYLLLILPVVTGLPAVAAGLGWLVKDTWGFAVHTRNIDKLGPLEYLLATPSHHRVHHAIDPIYAGKNFGFVFILWDKLFGTFQPELGEVPPTYGTPNSPRSFHPIAVAFHELRTVWGWAARTRRWRDKLRIWWMPAGWKPADVVEDPPVHVRHDPPAPDGLYVVGGLQLAYLVAGISHLAATVHDHGIAADLGYLGFLVLGSAISGDYFERRRGFVTLECARAAITAAVIVLTGGWFGRPLDAFAALTVGLGALSLLAALAYPRATALPSTAS